MTGSKEKLKAAPNIDSFQLSKLPGELGSFLPSAPTEVQPSGSTHKADTDWVAADEEDNEANGGPQLNGDVFGAAGLPEAKGLEDFVVGDSQLTLPSIDQCCLTLWFLIETGNVQAALSFLSDCDRRFGNGAASLRGELLERLVVRACSEVPSQDNASSADALILRDVPDLPAIAVPFLAKGPVISTHYTLLMAQVERQRSQIQALLSLFN